MNAMVQQAAKDLLRGGLEQHNVLSSRAAWHAPDFGALCSRYTADHGYKAEKVICHLGAQTCLQIRQEAALEGLQSFGELMCCCCKLCCGHNAVTLCAGNIWHPSADSDDSDSGM